MMLGPSFSSETKAVADVAKYFNLPQVRESLDLNQNNIFFIKLPYFTR